MYLVIFLTLYVYVLETHMRNYANVYESILPHVFRTQLAFFCLLNFLAMISSWFFTKEYSSPSSSSSIFLIVTILTFIHRIDCSICIYAFLNSEGLLYADLRFLRIQADWFIHWNTNGHMKNNGFSPSLLFDNIITGICEIGWFFFYCYRIFTSGLQNFILL